MDKLATYIIESGPNSITLFLGIAFLALSLYCIHYVYSDMKEKTKKSKEDQSSLQKMALDLHDIKNSMQVEKSLFMQVRDDLKKSKEETGLWARDFQHRLVRLETINEIKSLKARGEI